MAQVFNNLSEESLHQIAGNMLAEVVARVEAAGVLLRVAPAVAEVVVTAALSQAGADAFGARGMRRSICVLLENPLSELLLDAGVVGGYSSASSASDSEGPDKGALALHRHFLLRYTAKFAPYSLPAVPSLGFVSHRHCHR